MVAKGHHFPGVSVAAVVDADAGLSFPDFRSEERTFQLVTQLAGRSGRDAPGKVIVQTFQPDAVPFGYAVRHDVAGFLAREVARREELDYPPFHNLVALVVSGPDLETPLRALRELRAALERPGVRLLGPARSFVYAGAIASSCWRKTRPRGPSRRVLPRCSRPPLRRCDAMV